MTYRPVPITVADLESLKRIAKEAGLPIEDVARRMLSPFIAEALPARPVNAVLPSLSREVTGYCDF